MQYVNGDLLSFIFGGEIGERVGKGGCQTVATLIEGMAVVSFYPYKGDVVNLQKIQKLLPQIGVERGGFVGFSPTFASP